MVLPDKKVKVQLIDAIKKAKKRIWIEMYTWTDKDILDAVLKAKSRWVEVRVILEGNVFGMPYINKPIATALQNANIPLRYADNERFVFTHAKFILIDDLYFVSTGNLTRSFFEKNRDFIVSDSDKNIVNFLEKIFLADFSYQWFTDISPDDPFFLLSPINARWQVQRLLQWSKEDIIIYVQTLTDKEILHLLEEKRMSGLAVSICTADNQENRKTSRLYKDLKWAFVKKPYLHAKVLIFDTEYAVITSNNLTKNSLDNNREVWLIFSKNSWIIDHVFRLFQKDCIF
jgi:cardiolipin synthase